MNELNLPTLTEQFRLDAQAVIITGGAGLLGGQHGEAVAEMGGIPILVDIDEDGVKESSKKIATQYQTPCHGYNVDITKKEQLEWLHQQIRNDIGEVAVLINNAAVNPKMEGLQSPGFESKFETLSLDRWNKEVEVGLTGAFLCSQVFGTAMAQRNKGVILNIASDLAVIAPDQRIYQEPGLPEDQQTVKPVTYSVIKTGLLGLTRYLSTYWADKGVRVNSLSPAGVYNGQSEDFVKRLSHLIPLGRMAHKHEYRAAVIFLISDASSFMTGANLIVDGGRTVW